MTSDTALYDTTRLALANDAWSAYVSLLGLSGDETNAIAHARLHGAWNPMHRLGVTGGRLLQRDDPTTFAFHGQ